MTYLGYFYYFIGLQVLKTEEWSFISQYKYACDLLECFHMKYCKPTPSMFYFGVKLVATYTTPKVDATL